MKLFSIIALYFLLSAHFFFAQGIISSPVQVTDITTSSINLSWENSSNVESYVRYGFTKMLEQGQINGGTTSNPTITISNANPAQLIYAQAVVEDTDGNQDVSDTLVFITQSNSSGVKKAYFTKSVDHSYSSSTENNAIHLPQLVDDSLVAYISRAKESIDAALYNTTSSTSIADIIGALNQAHLNGVKVRVIYNENTANTGINENLHSDISRLESPPANFSENIGLMHNKFFIFDVDAENPNLPTLWTGSTNLTVQQINTDANNVIIIQDQSLAKVYTMEFEEMWGSNTMVPDEVNSRFGIDKLDDTPHVLNIGGDRVEVYFSPSDNTNDRIIDAIGEAKDDLIVNTMLITRNDIASAINFRHAMGTEIGVQVNSEGQTFTFENLHNSLGSKLAEYTGVVGTLHHKLMIGNTLSGNNPFVLTGSHNWSSSAEERNDENTLIIYNQDIANQYFQEFMARYEPVVAAINTENDQAIVGNNQAYEIDVLENDEFYFTATPFTLITQEPKNGNASVTEDNKISYQANAGFDGVDSLQYNACSPALFDYCESGWLFITVDENVGLENFTASPVLIYPNPVSNELKIKTNEQLENVNIYSLSGKLLRSKIFSNYSDDDKSIHLDGLSKGTYLIDLQFSSEVRIRQKVVVN